MPLPPSLLNWFEVYLAVLGKSIINFKSSFLARTPEQIHWYSMQAIGSGKLFLTITTYNDMSLTKQEKIQ